MDVNKYIRSAHLITPGLLLGNEAASKNLKILKSIDVIINATKHIPFTSLMGKKLVQIRVPVNDPGPQKGNEVSLLNDDNKLMFQYLPDVVARIKTHRNIGHKILIHCHAGAQRSAAIMTAYLVQHGVWNIPATMKASLSPRDLRRLKFRSAVNLLVKKRPVAFFGGRSINFKPALVAYLDL